jgi:hypothetical protein
MPRPAASWASVPKAIPKVVPKLVPKAVPKAIPAGGPAGRRHGDIPGNRAAPGQRVAQPGGHAGVLLPAVDPVVVPAVAAALRSRGASPSERLARGRLVTISRFSITQLTDLRGRCADPWSRVELVDAPHQVSACWRAGASMKVDLGEAA